MKVLLATDGSQRAENAAALLAHLPHSEQIELVVLSVTQPSYLHGSHEGIEWIKKQQNNERLLASEACQKVADMFQGANARVTWKTCEGHPGRRIVTEADDMQADLIVVGAEGHSMIDRMLLGSVSDFVATHASQSVLVVRPTGLEEKHGQAFKVCVAHDASQPAEYAVAQLSKFDWRQNTHIHVVSVLNFPFIYTDQPVEIQIDPIRRATEKSLEKSAASLRELSSQVSTAVIEAHHIGDGIVSFLDQNDCDLVVLGSTGQSLLQRFLLGSVATYVLRHATCSVWIAREQADKSQPEQRDDQAEPAQHS